MNSTFTLLDTADVILVVTNGSLNVLTRLFCSQLSCMILHHCGFLERDLGLPAPTSINETRAEVFAARYRHEPE